MKKIILTVVIFIVTGVGYWLISPLFINKKVDEKLEDIIDVSRSSSEAQITSEQISSISPEIIAEGSFIGLDGHSAEGKARLLKVNDKYFLRLDDDFRVTNGPDLFIHFGKNDRYEPSAKIARLKGNVGGQNYEIPSGINPFDYNEIWVWCRSFSVPFGKAVFE